MHGYVQELPPIYDDHHSAWFEKPDLSFLKTPKRKTGKCSLHNSVVVQDSVNEDEDDGYVNYSVETDIVFQIGKLTLEEKKDAISRG